MTTTTTTLGPWTVGKDYHLENDNRIDILRVTNEFQDTGIVAQVRVFDQEEAQLTAKLIAAAPTMANALFTARKMIQKAGITYDNADIYNKIDHAIKSAGL